MRPAVVPHSAAAAVMSVSAVAQAMQLTMSHLRKAQSVHILPLLHKP